MADLKTKLTLDGSDFTRGMNDASKSVENFTDASKMSASELLKQMKSMDKVGRNTGNYRAQLAEITRQISDLTINYRAMSNEMKNSDFGRAVADKIQELTTKAGDYKDAIMDAQFAVKALASDTANWDTMKTGIDLVSSGLQVFVSTGIMGGKTTEQLVEVLTKLKAVEAATNAAIKIGNAIQSQSALMMGIAKIQSLALTKARTLEAAATGKATLAQKLLNTVAKANPYVLLASAVATVVTAFVVFSKRASEAKQKEEELQKQTEKLQKKFDDFKTSISSNVGKVVGQFANLQRQWGNLESIASKKQWISDNANEFQQLGLNIVDVNSAEKILVEQADDVIAALRAKAEATATMQLYMEQYTKVVEAQIEANKMLQEAQSRPRTQYTGGSIFGSSIPEEWQVAGLSQGTGDLDFKWGGGQSGAGYWTLTQQGYEKYINYVREQGQKLVDEAKMDVAEYEKMVNDAEKRAQQSASKIQGLLTSNVTDNVVDEVIPAVQEIEIKYEEGSYAEAQAKISELQTMLNNLNPNKEGYKDIQAELEEWKGKLELIKELMGQTNKEVKPVAGSYAEAAAMVSMLSKELQNLKPDTDEFRNVKTELIEWTNILEEIKSQMQIVKETAQEIEKIDPFDAWKTGFSAIGNISGAIQSVGENIIEMQDRIESAENGFEKVFVVINSILGTIQAISVVMEAINTLQELQNMLSSTQLATETAKATTMTTEATIESGMTSTKAENAIIDTTDAAASAAKSASAIPIVGWAIAIGAVAAIIAAIAGASSSLKFAQGGIVPGSSFAGDHIHAQLNSGEMVLNKTQQQRLFNMLDSENSSMNGKVEFVIKGQELKGVLNNYDKKMKRI